MPVLGTGIHEFAHGIGLSRPTKLVDAKAKPWHDGRLNASVRYSARAISTNFSPCQSKRSRVIQPSFA
jgi:hypothetical protein